MKFLWIRSGGSGKPRYSWRYASYPSGLPEVAPRHHAARAVDAQSLAAILVPGLETPVDASAGLSANFGKSVMRRISWNFTELSAQSVQSIIVSFAAKTQPKPATMPTLLGSFEITLPKLRAKFLLEGLLSVLIGPVLEYVVEHACVCGLRFAENTALLNKISAHRCRAYNQRWPSIPGETARFEFADGAFAGREFLVGTTAGTFWETFCPDGSQSSFAASSGLI